MWSSFWNTSSASAIVEDDDEYLPNEDSADDSRRSELTLLLRSQCRAESCSQGSGLEFHSRISPSPSRRSRRSRSRSSNSSSSLGDPHHYQQQHHHLSCSHHHHFEQQQQQHSLSGTAAAAAAKRLNFDLMGEITEEEEEIDEDQVISARKLRFLPTQGVVVASSLAERNEGSSRKGGRRHMRRKEEGRRRKENNSQTGDKEGEEVGKQDQSYLFRNRDAAWDDQATVVTVTEETMMTRTLTMASDKVTSSESRRRSTRKRQEKVPSDSNSAMATSTPTKSRPPPSLPDRLIDDTSPVHSSSFCADKNLSWIHAPRTNYTYVNTPTYSPTMASSGQTGGGRVDLPHMARRPLGEGGGGFDHYVQYSATQRTETATKIHTHHRYSTNTTSRYLSRFFGLILIILRKVLYEIPVAVTMADTWLLLKTPKVASSSNSNSYLTHTRSALGAAWRLVQRSYSAVFNVLSSTTSSVWAATNSVFSGVAERVRNVFPNEPKSFVEVVDYVLIRHFIYREIVHEPTCGSGPGHKSPEAKTAALPGEKGGMVETETSSASLLSRLACSSRAADVSLLFSSTWQKMRSLPTMVFGVSMSGLTMTAATMSTMAMSFFGWLNMCSRLVQNRVKTLAMSMSPNPEQWRLQETKTLHSTTSAAKTGVTRRRRRPVEIREEEYSDRRLEEENEENKLWWLLLLLLLPLLLLLFWLTGGDLSKVPVKALNFWHAVSGGVLLPLWEQVMYFFDGVINVTSQWPIAFHSLTSSAFHAGSSVVSDVYDYSTSSISTVATGIGSVFVVIGESIGLAGASLVVTMQDAASSLWTGLDSVVAAVGGGTAYGSTKVAETAATLLAHCSDMTGSVKEFVLGGVNAAMSSMSDISVYVWNILSFCGSSGVGVVESIALLIGNGADVILEFFTNLWSWTDDTSAYVSQMVELPWTLLTGSYNIASEIATTSFSYVALAYSSVVATLLSSTHKDAKDADVPAGMSLVMMTPSRLSSSRAFQEKVMENIVQDLNLLKSEMDQRWKGVEEKLLVSASVAPDDALDGYGSFTFEFEEELKNRHNTLLNDIVSKSIEKPSPEEKTDFGAMVEDKYLEKDIAGLKRADDLSEELYRFFAGLDLTNCCQDENAVALNIEQLDGAVESVMGGKLLRIAETLMQEGVNISSVETMIEDVFTRNKLEIQSTVKHTHTAAFLESTLAHLSPRLTELFVKNLTAGAKDRSSKQMTHWRTLVEEELLRYDSDKTGRFDFALESSGGSVISIRCTEMYRRKTGAFTFFGIPIWYPTNNPRTAIQPGALPGECWPFKGSRGHLVVQLSQPVSPTGFAVEHISRSQSPDGKITSAPKDFAVYGLQEELDPEPLLLGRYAYDDAGDAVQHFAVQDGHGGKTFSYVELEILSNHGHPQYTCLYRFRVHGQP